MHDENNYATHCKQITIFLQPTGQMAPNKRNHDEDMVVYPKLHPERKKSPPEPKELPDFEPLPGVNMEKFGEPKLPPGVDTTKSINLFDLLLTPEIIKSLVDCTNAHRKANPPDIEDSWKDVTTEEMYGYFGILLWAGTFKYREMDLLWNTQEDKGPLSPLVGKAMGRNRWYQIDKYIHVIMPPKEEAPKRTPFQKVDQLSSELKANFAKYYTPGTHVAVDECIKRFKGRSPAIVNIPSKPDPTGFKVWVLAFHGYVLNWLWHHKGEKHGPVDLDQKWLDEGFTKTEAVVLTLLTRLPDAAKGCVVYLDNLFVSARLLRRLRELGIGACGTVRMTSTRREESDKRRQQKEEMEAYSSHSDSEQDQEQGDSDTQSDPEQGQEQGYSGIRSKTSTRSTKAGAKGKTGTKSKASTKSTHSDTEQGQEQGHSGTQNHPDPEQGQEQGHSGTRSKTSTQSTKASTKGKAGTKSTASTKSAHSVTEQGQEQGDSGTQNHPDPEQGQEQGHSGIRSKISTRSTKAGAKGKAGTKSTASTKSTHSDTEQGQEQGDSGTRNHHEGEGQGDSGTQSKISTRSSKTGAKGKASTKSKAGTQSAAGTKSTAKTKSSQSKTSTQDTDSNCQEVESAQTTQVSPKQLKYRLQRAMLNTIDPHNSNPAKTRIEAYKEANTGRTEEQGLAKRSGQPREPSYPKRQVEFRR